MLTVQTVNKTVLWVWSGFFENLYALGEVMKKKLDYAEQKKLNHS